MVADELIVELETVAGTEIHLQGERDVEFVFQSDDAVCTTFPRYVADLHFWRIWCVVCYRRIPTESETETPTHKSVQAFHKVSFIHEAWGDFH